MPGLSQHCPSQLYSVPGAEIKMEAFFNLYQVSFVCKHQGFSAKVNINARYWTSKMIERQKELKERAEWERQETGRDNKDIQNALARSQEKFFYDLSIENPVVEQKVKAALNKHGTLQSLRKLLASDEDRKECSQTIKKVYINRVDSLGNTDVAVAFQCKEKYTYTDDPTIQYHEYELHHYGTMNPQGQLVMSSNWEYN